MPTSDEKVVFVYNADSGKINSIKDFFSKVFTPDSYQCNLCAVSFGNFKMKKEWKDYTENSDVEMEFLHRDEFKEKYPEIKDSKFPCAYKSVQGNLTLLINQEEMNAVQNLDELIAITNEKLGKK
ncbi:MAG: hypothetical protein GF364_05645 [Candidatus Lokiarchaeota archaeon]|nr:hypothetical protein [Candidatus Lokiarchaeota archaeon]